MHNDKKLALDTILKAYTVAKRNIDLSDKLYIYCQLAFAYYINNKYLELEKVSIEALKYNNKIIDFYYYAAWLNSIK